MSVAKLIPLLDVECNDIRPTLRLYSNQSITMGRNNCTMIGLAEVSRELLRIEWKNDAILATPLKEGHNVQVNNKLLKGSTIIKNGEILSLHRSQVCYQIRYTAVSTKASELSSRAKRKFTDHVSCPICMEVIVQATMLVPCGHRYCKDCCPKVECASCRTKIQSYYPDKFIDAVISDMVKEQCLEADDSNMYIQRTEKKPRKLLSQVNEEDLRTPKRRKINQDSSTMRSSTSQPEVIVLS